MGEKDTMTWFTGKDRKAYALAELVASHIGIPLDQVWEVYQDILSEGITDFDRAFEFITTQWEQE
jgi:hypothetical protein